MSKLEWLRSLVEEVNQKHLPSRQFQSAHHEHIVPELSEVDSLEAIYNQGLKGIFEPSKAYRHIKGNEAKPYAFYETYPTFDRLNLNQLQWYMYWRQLMQIGIYSDTKEGYLFLYAFELLNLSFEPDPHKAIEMLIELYEAYKDRLPRVAATMPVWIGDMYTEFERPELAAIWYEKTTPLQHDTAMFETYEQTNTVPPFSVWKPFISEQTAFYRKHMEELDRCFEMMMEPLNQYFQKKRKKTLLEVILPEKWVIEHAGFYEWAVIERPVPLRRKVSYSPRYRGRGSSLDLLLACLRYVENHFREEAATRLLKVKESLLAKPLKALLDQVFAQYRTLYPRIEPERVGKKRPQKTSNTDQPDSRHTQVTVPVIVHIDPDIVETLHDESDWVRDTILAMEESEEQRTVAEFDLQQMFSPIGVTGELEDSWRDLLRKLTDVEQSILTWWSSHTVLHRNIQDVQEFVRAYGLMLHPVLDAINEKALEGLGDVLFEIVADEVYWNEEFAVLLNV